ncbi:aspartate carbamoyltransferase catalytic subunit [Cognatilysobacter lacus]|uniref:Aspartate carbamoyltransferase n=1 Tax=Cognatilysobacter lacus TaxID=1643323 RepID=A0A5D8Z880_9GAMM|nr:aspartate carbamoyltransferase catalytic subunit [Lysobacter lacus]TZF90332.1 aspartate carbamoyltransferase catalytic subunit [Lysobacter lacus]
MQHLLTLDGMPRATVVELLDRAQHFADLDGDADALHGIAICTLFFEPSTRTRMSFQLAAQRLGAHVLNFDVSTSSARKGETALDTMRNLEAMGVRGFVVRHHDDGAVAHLAAAARAGTALVNAGDGRSAHPTQGLLDMLTLRQAKGPDFATLRIAIVGDVKHSRVARSDLHALRCLGAGDIRVCAPAALLPDDGTLDGVRVTHDLDDALAGVDAVITLRLQRERMQDGLVDSLEGYHRDYGITAERLEGAAPDVVVMHPGPINRGVEITDEVADGPRALILRQVANGVAVRMAVLERLLAA